MNTVNLQDAVLIGADFTGATVTVSNLSGTNLTNAVLKNASFTDTTFRNATFTGANLTGAMFTGATLKDAIGLNTATLTGVVWTQTICPNGSNSGSAGGTCVAAGRRGSLPVRSLASPFFAEWAREPICQS